MDDLDLTFALTYSNDRVLPLFTGEVKPEGINLRCTDCHGVGMFYDQLKFDRYDISEMSFSSFLRRRPQGWDYVALPVFQARMFSHTSVLVRVASGVKKPEDLKGKRIGMADYSQTAAMWTRGILQHEFGVTPEDVEWFQERPERYSVGGTSGFQPPPGITFQYINTDLGTMLLRGELDAVILYRSGSTIDRPKPDLTKDRRFRPLFRDQKKEGLRYYKKNHIFPPHHVTVVRESIVKRYPWVTNSLMEALDRSKRLAMERLRQRPPSLLLFGAELLEDLRAVFGDDPYRHGIKANAKDIDTAQTYSVEQGITERKQPWEELFPEEIFIAEEMLTD